MEGPCASCAHEDGEEAGVDDTHEVGEEAGMGGGGQQIVLSRRHAWFGGGWSHSAAAVPA